ncbi:MAG TPA: type II toxin-antitoxin system RelE/ParE family toxin [bacterium]|mgnify:CR=1 FL=1|nr:type II toxin-antitoxin system RelE/ParE family toxin [bacterium]
MRYNIILSPEAVHDFKQIIAHDRAMIRDAMEIHLRYEPTKISKSRIKRLRGLDHPEFRLRVGDYRIFYDTGDTDVSILAIIPKSRASEWLERYGEAG